MRGKRESGAAAIKYRMKKSRHFDTVVKYPILSHNCHRHHTRPKRALATAPLHKGADIIEETCIAGITNSFLIMLMFYWATGT